MSKSIPKLMSEFDEELREEEERRLVRRRKLNNMYHRIEEWLNAIDNRGGKGLSHAELEFIVRDLNRFVQER